MWKDKEKETYPHGTHTTILAVNSLSNGQNQSVRQSIKIKTTKNWRINKAQTRKINHLNFCSWVT